MKLITEYKDSDLQYITESATAIEPRKTFIEGIFMQAEKENRNKRIYPRRILTEAVNRFVKEQVDTGRAVGELNHPDGPGINLDKVSHRITSLKWNGDDVIGKALILNTPMGLVVKGLIEGGVKLGVSSRGMGSVEDRNGSSYVKDDFILASVDIVQDPSASSAFVEGIMEGIEFFKDGDKFIRCKIENIQKTLAGSSKKKLAEAQERVFASFLASVAKHYKNF